MGSENHLEVTFKLDLGGRKEGWICIMRFYEGKTFQEIILMKKMSEMEKRGLFMKNNEHFNFNAT